jgi:LCP family protein required for cell wall assembly
VSRNDRAAKRIRHGSTSTGNTVLRVTAATIAGVLGFVVVGGTMYWENLQHSFTTQDISALVGDPTETATVATPTASVTADAAPVDAEAGNDINILLIGSDSRAGANGSIGGKVAEGMRSDTTMIMHISADRSRIDFLSIPRDMRVKVSDCKMLDGSVKKGWTGKFNIAFSLGGSNGNEAEAAACTMKTVQNWMGIKFDHYAVVDFAGFEKMIDAVDGVPMCVPYNIDDSRSKLHIKAGPHVLTGKKALAYARVRHIGDGTDLQRIERQQELMTNLAKKVLGMNVLTDAPQLTLLLKSAGQSMTMDPDLGSFTYLVGLAYSLRNIDQNNINFLTVPWKYAGDKSGDVLALDSAKWVFKRIVDDRPMVDKESTGTSASPNPSVSSSPTVSPTPERLTQKEILASCKA